MGLFDFIFPKNLQRRTSVSPEVEGRVREDWKKIDELVRVARPSALREALITADRTLDNVLREISSGESMGERLKNLRGRFNPVVYNKTWEAHKMRNALVHESGFEPPYYVLVQSINDLRESLKGLGVNL